MKICSKCKLYKNNFCKSSKNKDGLQSWCKDCVSKARLKRYYKNRQEERLKGNERNRLAYERNKKKAFAYLQSHPCVDCGETDPLVLEFDHRDPSTKVDVVSNLCKNYHNWNKVQQEIDKCDIRCANCHKKKTSLQLGYHKYL